LGELIVHRDHGIGKFDGIHTISALGIKIDMIKIIYGGGDTLFVPVDNIHLISRYGAENSLVQLDRLGVAGWRNRRDKVRKKIKVAAEELLKIAASRQLKKAPIFIAETHFYDEFRAKFGFVETEDQMRAIEEVEQDLQKGTPMDRLICGDVGFGKTEVALRGSAIVCKFAQIAIVAPTTLLVRQHYKNFCKRFEGTNVKVAQLSRLVSASEAKIAREEIENGKANIVIGTHALLQKNLKFHNLGLLIIDEVQHFGVAQKEQLKKFRTEIHVLTLSATPIPRTLQMSMAGVKDLSLIATPPIDRLAVRNFVMPFDSVIVREAVMREYNRSGKVFFVVPRIRDIEEMEPRLKIILPELKITHAHGQMNPSQLDDIMNDFIDGKIDVLLSTTIIESGIDISSANTMIIYKAEMFGLSQLYQLRGRVGRGKARGYCYFMLDNKHKIADESRKKLEVMQNLDALGVGFSVASHDMDIRGSGNLLGDEQSGHVKETGVELYQQMLVETIEKIKNNEEFSTDDIESFDKNITIKLGISLLIPEDYMSDLSLRMSFYKKISYIKNNQDRENLINEMTDRFGKIPQEILNLFEVALLKNLCQKVGVENLEIAQDGFIVAFKNNKFAGAEKLMKMIFENKNKMRLVSGQKLLFVANYKTLEEKINCAHDILKKLQNLL
jgi:transcription-repair coupling factor (superfamily II helicase)